MDRRRVCHPRAEETGNHILTLRRVANRQRQIAPMQSVGAREASFFLCTARKLAGLLGKGVFEMLRQGLRANPTRQKLRPGDSFSGRV